MAHLIAVTGGIGSGKSAVCKVLTYLGLRVYDCDSRAKSLMDSDPGIHRSLAAEISPEVIDGGRINRRRLAEIVFADPEMLRRLNGIVHGRVLDDIDAWSRRHAADKALFIETAILLESNLHRKVDAVWLVEADEDIRLERACARDNADREAIRARMKNQRRVSAADLTTPLHILDNNGSAPLLPRITELLAPYGVTPTDPGQWNG